MSVDSGESQFGGTRFVALDNKAPYVDTISGNVMTAAGSCYAMNIMPGVKTDSQPTLSNQITTWCGVAVGQSPQDTDSYAFSLSLATRSGEYSPIDVRPFPPASAAISG